MFLNAKLKSFRLDPASNAVARQQSAKLINKCSGSCTPLVLVIHINLSQRLFVPKLNQKLAQLIRVDCESAGAEADHNSNRAD